MSTVTLVLPTPPPRPQKRFTVAQYHRLLELGIIKKEDRCELIHGLIVEKPRVNPPHATAITRLLNRLFPLVAGTATLRIQLPVTCTDSEPEPDVVIAVGTEEDYEHRHPGPRDVLLLVEVSDSTLDDDTTTKLQLYAAEKVAQYWVINLIDRRVEVYTNPRGGKAPAYRTRTEYTPGQSVPVTIGKKTVGSISVSELLP
jgi:Uma2 family endonuclease